MTPTSFVLILLATGAVAFFALFPLISGGTTQSTAQRAGAGGGTPRQNQLYEALWTEKLRLLRALRDLDFDYDMGKLPDTVYATQRIGLIRTAAAVTQRMDDLEAEMRSRDVRLEESIASLRHARH